MADTREKRDLVLAPGTYAYMQDVTTGAVKTFVGPCVINQTAQEVPVVYSPRDGTFHRCNALEEAVRRSPIAVEGFYLMLKNPAIREGEEHPVRGSSGKNAPELQVGRKVNIPGPCMFALWPGQDAQAVRGHHLRSNQYLLVRVYNEEEARANWGKAVVKPAEGADGAADSAPLATAPAPPELTVGKLLIIKGTEVSFYIPPTGIGVVPEGRDSDGKLRYVRDAMTLERLEYCILVDEDGRKRYERGPKVVFPEPTETFIERSGQRKYRAIELNEIQGLHIKVIAPYVDEKTHTEYKEGDELFITGKETAIYFPREEHSSISYDGKAKHFATAIPAGEARYVMDRISGEIEMVDGPAMLLPDPRNKVIIRRVLSDKQVGLWYPGNEEALEYNRHLRSLLTSVPTTRQGAISEGDYERGTRRAKKDQRRMQLVQTAEMEKAITGDQDLVADEFTRASTYTQPRTVTLDTKFQGVPSIDVWTGYAIMVVSKTGTRRVVQGPTTVLLRYDESLEVLELSTGRPKSADSTLQTVFLRTVANKVSDVIEVETSDHVRVEVTLSHKVNFEDESSKWFDVENYVQFLCDHVRSVLKGAIKKVKIEEFYALSVDIIRDVILGPAAEAGGDRPGMGFAENAMRVADVELLKVRIFDDRIRGLMDQAQHQVVKSNIEVSGAQRELEMTRRMEEIARETARSKQETRMLLMELNDTLHAREQQIQLLQVSRGLELDQTEHGRRLKSTEHAALVSARETETELAIHAASLQRQKDDQDLRLQMIGSQTKSVVEQSKAISPHLVTALERLADEKLLSSLAVGFGEFAAAKGVGLLESARQFFDFLPDDKLRVLRHIGRGYQRGGDGEEKGE